MLLLLGKEHIDNPCSILTKTSHIDSMPHQTMDGEARAAYESQSLQLRAELKKWENEWAAARGGKKPGRDDIKQNPDIGTSPHHLQN